MSDGVRNVFISHIHEDDAEVTAMKELLAKNGCEIRDSSIDSSKPNDAQSPEYIKSEILAPCIQWAGAVIVIISDGTHESEWVDWEIEYAQKLGKPIIGVWKPGSTDADLPEKLDLYANAVVGWDGKVILDAISGKLHSWVNAAGKARAVREIARYSC